jgi:hypothetical protein
MGLTALENVKWLWKESIRFYYDTYVYKKLVMPYKDYQIRVINFVAD